MRVTDYTAPARGRADDTVNMQRAPAAAAADDRAQLEMALLRARVTHLEAVIETARGLMTSNQERLLRRLYEVPAEIAQLSARLHGIPGTVMSAPCGTGD